jgi:nucleotide sugar dehydrogenase
MNIVVVGAGKMGLPLACQLANNGGIVTVCDIKIDLVEKINRAEAPFEEPGLDDFLKRNIIAGRLKASTELPKVVSEADVIIIIVPAILSEDKDIDFSNLIAASEEVAQGIKPGTLVSYETTVPIGGCRQTLIPVLEKRGMKAGKDFYVCFSPERVKSMHVFANLQKNPKIVGGYNAASAKKAVDFYTQFLGAPVIDVGSMEAAEFVKLAGMVYRDVNIALANELAALGESVGLDFYRIRDAANTDGEAALLIPGIGVGGHCTPVYPYFLINYGKRLGIPQRLAQLSREINEFQPERHIARLANAMGTLNNKRVHILGVAFRPEVKEHAYSPAFSLVKALEMHGAIASVEDPLYSDDEIQRLGFVPATVGTGIIHAVILNTAHSAFKKQNFPYWRERGVTAVLDGRNFWSQEEVVQAGLLYLCVGKP